MHQPIYELVINIIGVAGVAFVVVRELGFLETGPFMRLWISIQIVFNLLFLIELIADLLIHGIIRSYKQHFRIWPETFCQFLNLFAMVRYFVNYESLMTFSGTITLFELIIFIRVLKLLTLVYEIKVMRIIIETMRTMLLPLIGLLSCLLLTYYIFALVGMAMFGGKIRKGSTDPDVPSYYHLNNFNDFASSMLTLFSLMVVNNWMLIAQMYVSVLGSRYYRWFFGLHFLFTVIIGMSIIIAFTLDVYSSVDRLD